MASDDIQGKITDVNGNEISGATVHLISQDTGQQVATTTTDSNGNYIFNGHPDGDGTTQNWHVVAEYDDGTDQFNTKSKPYVSAQLPADVSSSYDAVIPTSSYTASDGEMVISDGYTVTLPSPQQNAIVGVSAVSAVTIDSSSGSVETQTSGTLDSNKSAQFVGDGSDWYLITDRSKFS